MPPSGVTRQQGESVNRRETRTSLTSSLNTYTEEFVILDRCKLLGKARLIDLLQSITELKVNRARYANPLTLLPGNVPIQCHLKQLFTETTPFVICYFDLDNFKPFNDVYGFSKGDEILLFVGQLLRKHADCTECFLGHIGGDDFVLISSHNNWQSSVNNILEEFDDAIHTFYEDQAKEITAHDRNGELRTFSVMSLSVGVVKVENPLAAGHINLGEEAAVAKHKAKAVPRSSVYIHYIGGEPDDVGTTSRQPALRVV
jgi:diguanylate cyclase (GGDEF)-like protein